MNNVLVISALGLLALGAPAMSPSRLSEEAWSGLRPLQASTAHKTIAVF